MQHEAYASTGAERDWQETHRVFFSWYGTVGPWRCCFCPEPITYRGRDSARNSDLFPRAGCLSIEHVDWDPANNALENLRPAHSSCNAKAFWKRATPEWVAARGVIVSAAQRERWASMTPEERSEHGRRAAAARDPDAHIERVRQQWAARTPEERSAIALKGHESKTPEQRSASARKWMAAKTPEEMSEKARKANASRTPEERSAAVRKAWETRRRNANR